MFLKAGQSKQDRGEEPAVASVLRSAGQSLDASTRNAMDSRFHHDFSRVRVHTDVEASESARALNALAYTLGRDVVFRAGHDAPATQAGKDLIEHELGHVIEQEARPDLGIQRKADPAKETDPEETEKKKKPAHRLAHPRSGNFPGAGLLSRFGLMRGKYFRHLGWPKKGKKEVDYEWKKVVVGKKLVRVEERDSGNEHLHLDTMKDMRFNNLEYDGEPVTRTLHQAAMGGVFADPPETTAPAGGTLIDTSSASTVTGVLEYSLGEPSGSRKNRKGRIIVNALSNDMGDKKTAVYDSGG
jgi:hypothetical protein